MGYETMADRRKYQLCDNCIFIKGCFVQEIQREQEAAGFGNDCLIYQDERDLPPSERTTRYDKVVNLPDYTFRMRRPKS